MKIRFCSDLHTEFEPISFTPTDQDIFILAGDIALHTDSISFAKKIAEEWNIPVIIIAGNHEFYCFDFGNDWKYTWESTIDDLRAAADYSDKMEKGKVTYLENNSVVYEGVRFIGATLWTDMLLYGDDPVAKYLVWKSLNDYNVIYRKDGGRLLVEDGIERHGISRKFIEATLEEPFDGPTVVITHHAPSWLSVHEKYRDDRVSAGYASRLEPLIETGKPKLWIHGNMHTSFDYELYDTRVLCNPRGYNNENPDFNPNLIVEIK